MAKRNIVPAQYATVARAVFRFFLFFQLHSRTYDVKESAQLIPPGVRRVRCEITVNDVCAIPDVARNFDVNSRKGSGDFHEKVLGHEFCDTPSCCPSL
jgi:hypothetical protein